MSLDALHTRLLIHDCLAPLSPQGCAPQGAPEQEAARGTAGLDCAHKQDPATQARHMSIPPPLHCCWPVLGSSVCVHFVRGACAPPACAPCVTGWRPLRAGNPRPARARAAPRFVALPPVQLQARRKRQNGDWSVFGLRTLGSQTLHAFTLHGAQSLGKVLGRTAPSYPPASSVLCMPRLHWLPPMCNLMRPPGWQGTCACAGVGTRETRDTPHSL